MTRKARDSQQCFFPDLCIHIKLCVLHLQKLYHSACTDKTVGRDPQVTFQGAWKGKQGDLLVFDDNKAPVAQRRTIRLCH